MNAEAFFQAYVVCALWSSNDESTESGGDPLDDNHGPEDIAKPTLRAMREDCEDFLKSNAHLLVGWTAEQAGHDFWLTRNHHGAGFWDRGLPNGADLTKSAHAYGSVDLCVGDDGLIY